MLVAVRYSSFVALLAEGVDRNISHFGLVYLVKRSPSSRRAWIEIPNATIKSPSVIVALLAEGVDRNTERDDKVAERNFVALLAEGVDRNRFSDGLRDPEYCVALLAEGVDRNLPCSVFCRFGAGRPPRGGRG